MAASIRPSVAGEYHGHDFEWAELAHECENILKERFEDKISQDVNLVELSANNNDIFAQHTDGPKSQLAESSESLMVTQEHSATNSVATELAGNTKSSWELFHARNKGKFYKLRRYLVQEFPQLLWSPVAGKSKTTILEFGCGHGAAMLPILQVSQHAYGIAFDYSKEAINIFEQNSMYDSGRCQLFVCDITQERLPSFIEDNAVDVVLMVFSLSAMLPETYCHVLSEAFRVLRPGGVVCFRDYGLYDLSMMRSHKRLSNRLYYRGEGTLAYFFSTDDLERQFSQVGFTTLENDYCTVALKNRKTSRVMKRVWIHGVFEKPAE